ncbi:hypothetical protein [Pontibacter sp. H249]|uniref:hypothetical protein n=1 Tax=Pontibacter sp. H249 TaxID=3133420 RepID=UPI0030C544A3
MTRGIITIATGNKRYLEMAKNLAKSLTLNMPSVSKAVITDSIDHEFHSYYDFVIPVDKGKGNGIIQKLYIYDYSPFDETIFIDVDCLVVREFNFLWTLFQNEDVSVIGRKVFSGKIWGSTIENFKAKLNIEYLLSFNGGVYYFKKNKIAEQVFNKAKTLVTSYDELGIDRHRGGINEEPLMSLAMGIFRMNSIDDERLGMYTPVNLKGTINIDVLKGKCEFVKGDTLVSPAIMHFGGGYPEAFHYRRESRKIDLVYQFKLNRSFTSSLVNIIYNSLYVPYVFIYRLIKCLIKGEKMKLKPLIPTFRFE